MNPFDEGRGVGGGEGGQLVGGAYSGAYPHAECGDLQYALDGEHPREAHVHVLQRVLVRVALPMELQCMTLTNTRAERKTDKTGVNKPINFPRVYTRRKFTLPPIPSPPPSPLLSTLSPLLERGEKECENQGEEGGKGCSSSGEPSIIDAFFCNAICFLFFFFFF